MASFIRSIQYVVGCLFLFGATCLGGHPCYSSSLLRFAAGQDPDGAHPLAGIVEGRDGWLYGTTYDGGSGGTGTVYRIRPNGDYVTIHSFTKLELRPPGISDGAHPSARLVLDGDGSLYGTTYYGGRYNSGTVFRILTQLASQYETVYSFLSGRNECNHPSSALVLGPGGSLFGVTSGEGANADRGKVFKLTLGTEVPLDKEAELQAVDASTGVAYPFIGGPRSELTVGNDGNLYGTTSGVPGDWGTIFSVTPTLKLTLIRSFANSSIDNGGAPQGKLIEVFHNGTFYGTTTVGGEHGWGSVFRITTGNSVLVTIHSFSFSEGASPHGGLAAAPDGFLYGTTERGGPGLSDQGTIYRISAEGKTTVIHSFTGPDGAHPIGELLLTEDGFFYGTTRDGGAYNKGAIFKIRPTGEFTLLHSFGAPPVADPPVAAGQPRPEGRTAPPVFTDIDGTWQGEYDNPFAPLPAAITFAKSGETYTGELRITQLGLAPVVKVYRLSGIRRDREKLEFVTPDGKSVKAIMSADLSKLTAKFDLGELHLSRVP